MAALESANIVLIGNFNPYVISPEWLTRHDIWLADEVSMALGALKTDGVQFSGTDGTEWNVSATNLAISSTSQNCGEYAAKVLRLLPHTPVQAVGSNFNFSHEVENELVAVAAAISGELPKRIDPKLLRWGVVWHDDGVRREMALAYGDQGITVAVNNHRKVDSAEEAAEAAEKFTDDRIASTDFVDQLFSKGEA